MVNVGCGQVGAEVQIRSSLFGVICNVGDECLCVGAERTVGLETAAVEFQVRWACGGKAATEVYFDLPAVR